MPESAQSDSASPIQISLGRLQALEKDFQKHKDFWIGQEPYMRVILETTQLIHQGLVATLVKLDKRQGQAIQDLSKRIDDLLDQTRTAAAKQTTPEHEAAVSEAIGGTPVSGQGMLFDTKPEALRNILMNHLQALHKEIADVGTAQTKIMKSLANVDTRLNAQDVMLASLYEKATSHGGSLSVSETDTADHETDASESETDSADHEADASESETTD